MTESDKSRINFCAKVFKAFGVQLRFWLIINWCFRLGNLGSVQTLIS